MPTVLVIDDNPLISDFVHLAVPDWHVVYAITGRKGLALLREHLASITVIVLDVGLPGMDGRLVCARIRALAPAVPIVPFTGNAFADDELREMGCEPAVLKSSSPDELASALHTALGRTATPPRATALLEFVQEYAAQLEQSENRGVAVAELPAECQPVPGAQLDDLDMHLVRQHIAHAAERRGYVGTLDPVAYLRRHMGVIETATGLVPTVIGVLMFAPDPNRWISAAGIDVVQFRGGSAAPQHLLYTQQIRGPLIDVINRTIDWLWARTEHHYDVVGTERIETHAYPLHVLRELTVNALCHRDWSYRGSTIRIQLFATHLEWITPGGLPAGVTTENLRTAQSSRNAALARLLYQAGMVEQLGLGMDTVIDTLQALGHAPPVFHNDGHFFTVQLRAKALASTSTDVAAPPLDRQARIIAEIRRQGSCSTAQLAELLGETLRTIQRDLRELTDAGVIVAVGATHNRRYRVRDPEPR